MVIDPNWGLGVATLAVAAIVFVIRLEARIAKHEAVCAERQRHIAAHLETIDKKLDSAIERRSHPRV